MSELDILEILKLVVYGIVEGITEWLPVSSTGHLLILEEYLPLKQLSPEFLSLFRIVIQLAAILAVILYFWQKLWPLKAYPNPRRPRNSYKPLRKNLFLDLDVLHTWLWVVVASLPAAIVGLLADEFFEKYFYNTISVALALIIVGIIFIVVERKMQGRRAKYKYVVELTWTAALVVGICQMLAGIFPGVSRSGACIIGALIMGFTRPLASEVSFFMAIPVMLGASLLKLIRLTVAPQATEWLALIISSLVAFVVSLMTIKYFMNFVKKHKFQVFAYYRIALGIVLLALFFI